MLRALRKVAGQPAVSHAGLYDPPAVRDRSDKHMAPPRAPDAQAPARAARVSVLLEVQVPEAHVGVQRPIRMVDVHRTGRGGASSSSTPLPF
jgi:hypothetical protein